jgi:hypothetical protein
MLMLRLRSAVRVINKDIESAVEENGARARAIAIGTSARTVILFAIVRI